MVSFVITENNHHRQAHWMTGVSLAFGQKTLTTQTPAASAMWGGREEARL